MEPSTTLGVDNLPEYQLHFKPGTTFPYYDHYTVKVQFADHVVVSKSFADSVIATIVEKMSLTVLNEHEYVFPNDGMTKVLILSQSHLIAHTWPEVGSIHLDILTCAPGIDFLPLRESFGAHDVKSLEVTELAY